MVFKLKMDNRKTQKRIKVPMSDGVFSDYGKKDYIELNQDWDDLKRRECIDAYGEDSLTVTSIPKEPRKKIEWENLKPITVIGTPAELR